MSAIKTLNDSEAAHLAKGASRAAPSPPPVGQSRGTCRRPILRVRVGRPPTRRFCSQRFGERCSVVMVVVVFVVVVVVLVVVIIMVTVRVSREVLLCLLDEVVCLVERHRGHQQT